MYIVCLPIQFILSTQERGLWGFYFKNKMEFVEFLKNWGVPAGIVTGILIFVAMLNFIYFLMDKGGKTVTGFLNIYKWWKERKQQKQDLADLVLAYCSTVHASQGSEYKIVFVILDDTSVNDFLHIRRLLYTAISRGKQKVYLLSKPYLVDKCIENNVYRPRITKLKEFLNEE